MKRTILAASLAVIAFVATSNKSQAQIITAGYGSPYNVYRSGYSPYYGYNYGRSFSFSFGAGNGFNNGYSNYGSSYYRPNYGYSSPFVGPRYSGYSNYNSGYRYGGNYGYRGRGYRR